LPFPRLGGFCPGFSGLPSRGVVPAAHSLFLVSPRKSKQKEGDPTATAPTGFPKGRLPKREAWKLAFGSDSHASLSASSTTLSAASEGTNSYPARLRPCRVLGATSAALDCTTGSLPAAYFAGTEPKPVRPTTRQCPESPPRAKPRLSAVDPLVTLPKEMLSKRIRSADCLSRRRASALPALAASLSGTPQGQRDRGRLLLLTFSWRSKKSKWPAGAKPGKPVRSTGPNRVTGETKLPGLALRQNPPPRRPSTPSA
jgi:hypothetical protein